ncbi:MAG: BamA/TamA family outer membrane protein [Deltaproteobacteria bacterium]|nr:BamA/TamA family outer membrane protein [Deltaproteobacteria bacterium]
MTRVLLAVAVLLFAFGAGAQTAADPGAAPAAGELPSLPVTLPDTAAFEGKTVTAVRAKLEGLLWTKPPVLQAPKVGAPFALAAARAELMRLLQGGGFSGGSLELEAKPGGVDVVFRLVPARLVRRIMFKGNDLGDDAVRRAAGLVDVRDVTEKSLEDARKRVREYFLLRGFPQAKVDVATIETDVPLVVLVQVTISAGPPSIVQRRVFAGLPPWDPNALALAQGYAVGSGDRADQEALDLADRTLTTALRGAGFPSATVSHALVPEGGGVALTVQVAAGSKVVPSFEGNVVFDREGILDVLDLENESDRSPLRLASKIEGAYRRLGYLDVLVETDLLGKPTDAQRTLLFRIREGDLVTVEKRLYPCLGGALSATRIDEEIDSFLDEDLAGEGFGDASGKPVDSTMGKSGDVASGARPKPHVPTARSIFVAETYDRAREHLVELYRSEGYMFVEIGEVGLLRAGCAKGSMPGPTGCKPTPLPKLDEKMLCLHDPNQLPLPVPPLDKKSACVADPLIGRECAPTVTVVLPINPGPRSFLWDVVFEGTHAASPAQLGKSKITGSHLRMGDPLSLRDIEAARKAIVDYYRDEGYWFVNVRVTFDYSTDKSRARVRFVINEGEQVVIEKIFVEGERHTLESLIRARLLIEEGGIYRAKLVRESQDRLVKLGVFQSVSIGLVNPNIPAKRKSVIINVVERPRQHFDYKIGYGLAEGFRFNGEYGYANIGGYAATLNVRLRMSYQPFLGCDTDNPGSCKLYDPVVVRRWSDETQVNGLRRYPRRASIGVTLPHTPIFGATVRTTLELVNILDLRRDFVLDKYSPILTFTYSPWQPLTLTFGGDLEYNSFRTFDSRTVEDILSGPTGGALAPLLRVPAGDTGVAAVNSTVTFDFRDNKLGATKNGYVSLSTEYVRSIVTAKNGPRQDFLHVFGGAGVYYKLGFLPKKPVLAFELRGGGNFNVGSCYGVGESAAARAVCDTYPDRLYYLGGVETNRGFFPGQLLPQDSIDQLLANPNAQLGAVACEEYPTDSAGRRMNVNAGVAEATGNSCGVQLGAIAPRGGNVFINPRLEMRVGAFRWGGFVVFVDASNAWRDRTQFRPWRLRYSVGPGISVDTPVGPVALDVGFNLTRYPQFGEPLAVFNFSIGRF